MKKITKAILVAAIAIIMILLLSACQKKEEPVKYAYVAPTTTVALEDLPPVAESPVMVNVYYDSLGKLISIPVEIVEDADNLVGTETTTTVRGYSPTTDSYFDVPIELVEYAVQNHLANAETNPWTPVP